MYFNFEKEMVYGKKHLNKLSFDKEKYESEKKRSEWLEETLERKHHVMRSEQMKLNEIEKILNRED